MKYPIIYFDMDGTLADFYNEPNWLENIENGDTAPYENAQALISEEELLKLKKQGYLLGIISWLCRGGSDEFGIRTRKAKKEWLKENYPNIKFDEVHIVKYGTPKYSVAKIKNSILVDDEEKNRIAWKGLALNEHEVSVLI